MSLLCLNCRGLGAAQAVSDLCTLLRRLTPKVVFLSETKKSTPEMKNLLPNLGDYHGLFVDARGRSGGLGLLWLETVTMNLLSCSLHHIDVTIQWENDDNLWRFSGIYGWPEKQLKEKTRELIHDLRAPSNLPWLIGGDLNEIFYHGEKKGKPPKPQASIDNFRSYFEGNELFDLGYSGYDFTWSNYQEDGITVEERLDRFCTDCEWSLVFPSAQVQHVDFDMSDHLPILLKCKTDKASTGSRKKRFHFKNMWFTNSLCKYIVHQAWSSPTQDDAVESLVSKL